jgi:hypothetical protein
MTRYVSGTYQRTDRVRAQPGSTVRLHAEDRRNARYVTLVELSLSDLLLSSSARPAVGSALTVTIALRDRHIELEVPAVVAWHRDDEFTITFDYLTARQTYGLTLAIALAQQAAERALLPAQAAHATRR